MKNSKNFLGGGTALSHWGGDTPPQTLSPRSLRPLDTRGLRPLEASRLEPPATVPPPSYQNFWIRSWLERLPMMHCASCCSSSHSSVTYTIRLQWLSLFMFVSGSELTLSVIDAWPHIFRNLPLPFRLLQQYQIILLVFVGKTVWTTCPLTLRCSSDTHTFHCQRYKVCLPI